MRVGVVGAGIAGLAAARHLANTGSEVTVFEGAAHVGGRCATLTIGAYTFDPGATSIVPRGREIERVMLEQLPTTDLVKIDSPVFTHDGRRVFLGTGMPPTARYCYKHGIRTLAELLAVGLNVHKNHRVDAIEAPADGGFSLFGQTFEAVVLAVPMGEAARLMAPIGDARRAYNTRYRSCLSVLLGLDKDFHTPYHAVVAEESVHPLHWLSIENIKVPGRAPAGHTALVVQLGPKYSRWNFEASDDSIVEDALVDVERVFGPGFDRPLLQHVVRWRESQPDSVSGFDSMNPPGSRLVVAGDGLEGGRIEHAYDSGIKAAKLLVGT
jgi:predicted NAD/FAD-dependent oxidoreductase